jgi:hypothetical protein
MNIELIYSLARKYGYKDIESKSPHMKSFSDGAFRMNIYNTGTVTLQSTIEKFDQGISVRCKSVEDFVKNFEPI